ncbi:glucosidase [soil metagenome]
MSEAQRLKENDGEGAVWHRWGPYLSERQWGTVREDYSTDGDAWNYLTHDDARSRAYRWGEDGIGGWCDRHGILNVALAFWNGKDPILKERLFGLSNPKGNHGEDVKECYWYLDATPTHAYGRMLYKYPQREFPYQELVKSNVEADRSDPEFDLPNSGIFDEDRYFDIEIEHAKADPTTAVFRVTVHNRGPEDAEIWVLPHVWFRNTWSWKMGVPHPSMRLEAGRIWIEHPRYGHMSFVAEDADEWLFTDNETNVERLFGAGNPQPYVKDAFHRQIVNGEEAANPQKRGTKGAAVHRANVPAGGSISVRYALVLHDGPKPDIDATIHHRRAEADAFYANLAPDLPHEVARVQRQALAGMLWNKQFYHFDVDTWLKGDPAQPPPPPGRTRNEDWRNIHPAEPMSMPDTWEYPWFAAWDLAFHTIPLALIDPKFAKDQLILLMREWMLHPSGQVPAYEWNFSDVNPPVHAWAALRVYEIDGRRDVRFLERVFHKLLLNFTWWVNRRDSQGNNVFEGGFLGLDNIGVFDRNRHLPDGYVLEESDATSWMAMFCLNMLDIALELSHHNLVYEDVASKFFEHFMYVATALNRTGVGGQDLWDENEGFYYDVLLHPDGTSEPNRVHSFVGLIPLFAVTTIEPEAIARFHGFRHRMEWFLDNRPDLTMNAASMETPGKGRRTLLSAVGKRRLDRILQKVLDPAEFLSDHGLRSLSKYHAEHPFMLQLAGEEHMVDYEPGESTSGSFGGNSNWRGPIWFPVNYLLIESLQKFDYYFGENFDVPDPEPGGPEMTLANVAADLETRLLGLFLPDENGRRPCNGGDDRLDFDPYWKDLIWFSEYFHGDTGKGLGASHQTGWTGLVAKLIQQLYVTAPHTRFEREK